MADLNELSTEVSRIIDYLELLIAARRIGIREIERRLDSSKGTLNRLFSGKVALKLQTLFNILEILEVTPEDFFSLVFSKDGGSSAGEEMLRRVQSLILPHPPPPPVLTREDIQRIVEEHFLTTAPPDSPPEPPPKPPLTERTRPRRGKPKT